MISIIKDDKRIETQTDKKASEIIQPDEITGPEISQTTAEEIRSIPSEELKNTSATDLSQAFSPDKK